MGRLDGKVAIITGAGRGIGRATAVRFAQEGAAVVVNDVDPEPAEETAQLVKEAGAEALVSTNNTVDLEEANRLTAAAAGQFGKIDILVNNAGITRDKTFHNMDDEVWDFVLDVNLKTAFHTTRAAMPYLRDAAKREKAEQGQPSYHRKITFTTSVAALVGNAGQANYTAAKGAIVALTKTLARELGPFWINVNAVAPGFIATEMLETVPEKVLDKIRAQVPLRRLGRPEEIARVVRFLCEDTSSYITGQVWAVNGGMEM